MSHHIKMKMPMKVEHRAELIAALEECYPDAQILTGEAASLVYVTGEKCDIVVQRSGQRDFGFVASSDGVDYEYRSYNPGTRDMRQVEADMSIVNDHCYPKIIEKILAPTGKSYVFGELKKKDGKTTMKVTVGDGGYV